MSIKPKLVYGVGINDAGYVVSTKEDLPPENGKRKQRLTWACPFYSEWMGILQRCYNKSFQQYRPTYQGCTIADDWLTFSIFKSWMESQTWQGNQLDKDILVPGNKHYSSATCIFIPQELNSFMTDNSASRGDCPIGVHYNKSNGRFQARCRSCGNRREHLGYFNTPDEAHEAWRKRKHELACQYADQQTDHRIANALRKRYLPEVPK